MTTGGLFGPRTLVRLRQPMMPVTAYQTYAIVSDRPEQVEPATCEQVECAAYQHGWTTKIDVSTELGQRQYAYITRESGRAYRLEDHRAESPIRAMVFEPGQRCFARHTRQVRPSLYLRQGGDFRGNPTGERYVHTRPEHWAEDFAEHQSGLADTIKRG